MKLRMANPFTIKSVSDRLKTTLRDSKDLVVEGFGAGLLQI